MWLDPGLLLSLKSEVLAGRDHTGEVLGVAILSFQRQPTPPFSFYSGLCRSCDVPPVGTFISSGRWFLDRRLEELATDLGASLSVRGACAVCDPRRWPHVWERRHITANRTWCLTNIDRL